MNIQELNMEMGSIFVNTDTCEIKQPLKIKYQQIEFSNKYQTVIYLPFRIVSSKTITDYSEPKQLKKRVKSLLKSALEKKYNDIKLRAYNHYKRFEFFKNIIKINIDDERLKEIYLTEIYTKELFEEIEGISNENIWNDLTNFKKITKLSEIDKLWKFELSWDNFCKMMLEGNCEYCGISIEQIITLAKKNKILTKRSRGYSMEIDQKKSNDNYSDNNCITCCYWCNNAKTDEFSPEEFKEIARGINAVWEKRGADIISFDKIEYWKHFDKSKL